MDFNIRTRFNIGDKVWVPEHYYDWYPIKKGYEVTNIEIQIDSQTQKIFYTIKNDVREVQKYPERLCFNSYDECKQWCNKENGV